MKKIKKHVGRSLTLLGIIAAILWALPGSGSGTALNVPEVFQEENQWCWAGVSQAIFQYYNTVLTQTEIATYGTSGYNTWNYLYGSDSEDPYYRKGINMIFTNWGLSCTYGGYIMSQTEVQDQIDSGRPFVIRWGWYSGGGHFVAGRGIETNIVHYMDPWPGNGYSSATYSWVVDDGNHEWTHSLELTSQASTTPQAPAGISASDGTYTDRVQVAWSVVTNATGYQLWRSTNDNTAYGTQIAEASGETSTNYDDLSAGHNTNYYYWAKATNSSGTSGFSESNSGYRGLSAPAGLSASDGTYTDKVSVSWTGSAGATGYELWRNTNDNVECGARIAEATGTNYNDTSAATNVLYYYQVKCTNMISSSAFSDGDSGFRISPSTPGALTAPTNVSASDGTYTDKVAVTWSEVSGASSYEVWRNMTNNSGTAENIGTTTGTNYNDLEPASGPGITYYYWVKAKNLITTSAFSPADMGYCRSGSTSGSADLAATSLLFEPPVVSAGSHPELVMVLLVNNGPDNMTNAAVSFDFYLSANTLCGDADDQWIGNYDEPVTLSADGYTTMIVSDDGLSGITIPDLTGVYYVFVRVRHASLLSDPDESNNTAMRSGTITIGAVEGSKRPVAGDFDGDRITDPAVYQEGTGNWNVKLSGAGYALVALSGFGGSGYEPMTGDYDNDGRDDPAIYQESTGDWYIRLSSAGYALVTVNMGGLGYKSTAGDFNGEGYSDLAVYREATGYWLILLAETASLTSHRFGHEGYVPVTGDFDGDGKTDLMLYQSATGSWHAKLSGSGYAEVSLTGFGGTGYAPVAGDYDGDGNDDLVLYENATGNWYARLSASGYAAVSLEGYGGSEYEPVTGDFDGDGRADLVLYRASTSSWCFRLSSIGYQQVELQF